MTKVLVIGASRGIGRASVDQLLSRGYSVRAFSRSPRQLNSNQDLEIVSGDALVDDNVREALTNVDVVVQALGIPANARMLTGPITLFSQATEILLNVMKEQGPRRLIAVTGFGAGDSKEAINRLQRLPFTLVFGRAYTDKSVQEELIKASDLDWTIVRPTVLTNSPFFRGYRVRSSRHQWRNGIISRRAVADYIARAVADRSTIHQAPVLTTL